MTDPSSPTSPLETLWDRLARSEGREHFEVLLELSARTARERQDLVRAATLAESALTVAQGCGDHGWLAEAHLAVGRVRLALHATDDAVEHLLTAAECAQRGVHLGLAAEAHLLAGQALVDAGDVGRAEQPLRTALGLADDIGDSGGAARAAYHLARVRLAGDDTDSALKLLERSRAACQQERAWLGVVEADMLRAQVLLTSGRAGEAVDVLQPLLHLAADLDEVDELPVRLRLGAALRQCGRLGHAERVLAVADELAVGRGDLARGGAVLLERARVAWQDGDRPTAFERLEGARARADAAGETTGHEACDEQRSSWRRLTGDYGDAVRVDRLLLRSDDPQTVLLAHARIADSYRASRAWSLCRAALDALEAWCGESREAAVLADGDGPGGRRWRVALRALALQRSDEPVLARDLARQARLTNRACATWRPWRGRATCSRGWTATTPRAPAPSRRTSRSTTSPAPRR